MATDQQDAPLPGDIIQVIDENLPAYSHLLIVQESRSWGVGAIMRSLQERATAESYHRLRGDQFVVCGAAALLPGELAQARRDAQEAADMQAREAGL